MESEEWVEVSAPTVEEATILALTRLGITREQAKIEELAKGSKGFLGIGSREARVRVSVVYRTEAAALLAEKPPKEEVAPPAPPKVEAAPPPPSQTEPSPPTPQTEPEVEAKAPAKVEEAPVMAPAPAATVQVEAKPEQPPEQPKPEAAPEPKAKAEPARKPVEKPKPAKDGLDRKSVV